jgi:hypothetical protein
MIRTLSAAAALLGASAMAVQKPGPPSRTLSPTTITVKQTDSALADVAGILGRASGLGIKADANVTKARCPVDFQGVPLWSALEKAAAVTNAKLIISDGGRTITLAPRGAAKEISSVSGPFRVVVRGVTGRLNLDSNVPIHELDLLVHWEPRYPVFRIDSNPKISAAKFDRTGDIITDSSISRHHPTNAMTEMKIRLAGLPRRAPKIDVVAGEFRATAATQLLTFGFNDLAATSTQEKIAGGVTAKLKPLTFDETTKTWDVELELIYPPGGPVFESFEEHKWLRDNRLQLVSPEGKPIDPDGEEALATGNRVDATYRFKTGNPKAKGWSLVYVAPGPLVEVTVPFRLENIPLP